MSDFNSVVKKTCFFFFFVSFLQPCIQRTLYSLHRPLSAAANSHSFVARLSFALVAAFATIDFPSPPTATRYPPKIDASDTQLPPPSRPPNRAFGHLSSMLMGQIICEEKLLSSSIWVSLGEQKKSIIAKREGEWRKRMLREKKTEKRREENRFYSQTLARFDPFFG